MKYGIRKVSNTFERGTLDGRNEVVLKEYHKTYKTEAIAKGILTKLGWKSENVKNNIGKGPNGNELINVVRWEVYEIK